MRHTAEKAKHLIESLTPTCAIFFSDGIESFFGNSRLETSPTSVSLQKRQRCWQLTFLVQN
jgi:hypothetical protein